MISCLLYVCSSRNLEYLRARGRFADCEAFANFWMISDTLHGLNIRCPAKDFSVRRDSELEVLVVVQT